MAKTGAVVNQAGAWAKLPYTSRVLAEQLVRRCDPQDLTASLEQLVYRKRDLDFPWFPVRVVCHDILGQTALVDLAGLRDAIADQGGDPAKINPVVPTQQPRGLLDVAGGQQLPDPGGGEATGFLPVLAVGGEILHHDDVEAVPAAQLPHGLQIPGVVSAEAHVRADHHGLRAQGIHEGLPDEVLGRGPGELQGVGQQQQGVQPGVGHQQPAVVPPHDRVVRPVGAVHLGRVRVEGDRHRAGPPGAGLIHHLREHAHVPAVHAVEVADGDHAGTEVLGHLPEAGEALHARGP